MRKIRFMVKKKNQGTVPSSQVRVNFDLDNEIHRRLRLEAVRRRLTIAGLISRWIADNTPPA